MVEEQEGPRLIVGLYNIDAQVRQEEEYARRLAKVQIQANTDALTGGKEPSVFKRGPMRVREQGRVEIW